MHVVHFVENCRETRGEAERSAIAVLCTMGKITKPAQIDRRINSGNERLGRTIFRRFYANCFAIAFSRSKTFVSLEIENYFKLYDANNDAWALIHIRFFFNNDNQIFFYSSILSILYLYSVLCQLIRLFNYL